MDDVPFGPRPGSHPSTGNEPTSLYRMNSNQSRSSVFEDVEMAHDEVSSMNKKLAFTASNKSSFSCTPDLLPKASLRAYQPSPIGDIVPTLQRVSPIMRTSQRYTRMLMPRTVFPGRVSSTSIPGVASPILAIWNLAQSLIPLRMRMITMMMVMMMRMMMIRQVGFTRPLEMTMFFIADHPPNPAILFMRNFSEIGRAHV